MLYVKTWKKRTKSSWVMIRWNVALTSVSWWWVCVMQNVDDYSCVCTYSWNKVQTSALLASGQKIARPFSNWAYAIWPAPDDSLLQVERMSLRDVKMASTWNLRFQSWVRVGRGEFNSGRKRLCACLGKRDSSYWYLLWEEWSFPELWPTSALSCIPPWCEWY